MSHRPLRIAVYYHLPFGGAQRALYYHLRGLQERGHELATFGPPRFVGDRIIDLGIPHFESSEPVVLPEGTTYLQRVLRQFNRGRVLAHTVLKSNLRSAAQIEQWKPHVLFANTSTHIQVPPIGALVNSERGIPSVLYLQEPNRTIFEANPGAGQAWLKPPSEWFGSSPVTKFKRRIREVTLFWNSQNRARNETENVAAFDLVLANSYFSRENLIRTYGPRNVKVCYLGVDLEMFPHAGLSRQNFVISVGSFTAKKNPELAVKALGMLPAPKPKFVWVANYANPVLAYEVGEIAKGLGVEFELLVNIPDSELLELLNLASAMIYTPTLEPFGFAPLEANACGLPVVAVAEGGCRETIEHGVNGYLAEPTPASIAEYVSRLLGGNTLTCNSADLLRRHVETNWSVNDATLRLEQHLASVTSR